jgi:hypothetical protein
MKYGCHRCSNAWEKNKPIQVCHLAYLQQISRFKMILQFGLFSILKRMEAFFLFLLNFNKTYKFLRNSNFVLVYFSKFSWKFGRFPIWEFSLFKLLIAKFGLLFFRAAWQPWTNFSGWQNSTTILDRCRMQIFFFLSKITFDCHPHQPHWAVGGAEYRDGPLNSSLTHVAI